MHDRHLYDYAIVRAVPRPEREEFVNVGVIVSCPTLKFLQAWIELDAARVRSLDPDADLDVLCAHLDGIARVCAGGADAGPIGRLGQRERFHWLVAPRSAMIQISAVHTGHCEAPAQALDRLVRTMVRR